jgi:hypothetical protein
MARLHKGRYCAAICSMILIPTAKKQRLPKGFSYPLGAEAISAAFAGVPQLENASLWFSWRDEYWASEWRRRIDALGEVRF